MNGWQTAGIITGCFVMDFGIAGLWVYTRRRMRQWRDGHG